ncbi:MAG TPA: ABC transporter permease, partial [Blastocatellia bacterium]|nr:ABC transporter permease [Blastocatellia bacterium]
MGTLFQDLRYALRMLFKKPAFTIVAVMTLALGIGANSTIFSFVNGILLRPLPYQNPERLMMLDETASKRGVSSMGVSFPNFADWREQNHVFEDIAAYQGDTYTVVDGGEPEQISGARVSAGMFEILGVSPTLGRTFLTEEDHPNQDAVILLSDGLWRRRFAADPNIIGQTITTGSRPRTVIGVMPSGFKFPDVADLWVPMALNSELWTRNDHGLSAIARLKEGVTIEQAQAEMNTIALHIEEKNPVTNEGMGVNVFRLHESLTGDYRQALIILLGVVGFVLLIACANVANLLLVRASARQKEVAIRSALGASPRRIFRQLLTESLLLGLIGGALGLVIAVWGRDLLLAAIPGEMPFWMKFNLDGRVLGFTLGVSILTGLVFGVVPSLQAANPNLNEALKEGGRDTAGAGHNRLRGPLVIFEVALSLVLLVGAGLLVKSFWRLSQVNPGFDPQN